MKHVSVLLLLIVMLSSKKLTAQDSAQHCQVIKSDLKGAYTGGCKKGFADGKGEAIGFNKYTGNFKNGLPYGEGIYYYGDNIYHKGKFQEGIKEGKGEMHYLRNGKSDSIIKGYWSGDEYRGKSYVTYSIFGGPQFSAEVEPIADEGSSVQVVLMQRSGATSKIYTLRDLMSIDGSFVQRLPENRGINTFTYALYSFPIQLQINLNDGGPNIKLDLYKKARWLVRILIVQ